MLQLYNKAVPNNAPHLFHQVSLGGKQVLARRSIAMGQTVVKMAICTAWDQYINQLCVEVEAGVMKGRSTACIVIHNTTPPS